MDLGFNHEIWHEIGHQTRRDMRGDSLRDLGHDSGRGERNPAGLAADGSAPLDWHALRARLLAARASRRAIASVARSGPRLAEASFDAATARRLRGKGDCFTPVNPVSLTDRKTGVDIVTAFVGETRTGDRG